MKNQAKNNMKKILLLVLLCLLAITANAQSKVKTPVDTLGKVYTFAEQMPFFPGGSGAMMKFIGENLRYPSTCETIQGRVIISFIVEKDGSLSHFEVKRSADPLLDKEAMRVCQSMPKWIPGKLNGKVVRVKYNVPVTFKLQAEEQSQTTTPVDTFGKVYTIVEQIPSFPGGIQALMKFLAENIHYPVDAQRNGIQGRVIIGFIVEKDGSLSHFKVTRSVDPLLDKEAMRVCQSMPKWIPGKQNGEVVRVKYNVPINFKL
jgi:TonB family protein